MRKARPRPSHADVCADPARRVRAKDTLRVHYSIVHGRTAGAESNGNECNRTWKAQKIVWERATGVKSS